MPIKISTHAPLAGRDERAGFQDVANIKISTHAPLAGRDYDPSPLFWFYYISTHAPLAGRDISIIIAKIPTN